MPGFLSSNLYYKYLSDLINSVRADEFVNVSASGQGGLADSERFGSNASDGPQMQVSVASLTPPHTNTPPCPPLWACVPLPADI